MTGLRALAFWRAGLLVCGAALFAVALSREAYELTSPATLSWHVLLRKTYSIGAFAVIGFLVRRSALAGLGTTGAIAGAVALYSAAIEAGQYLTGVREGLASNAFDVLCGLAGGALGALVARLI